jgi:hypothetical protein
VDGEYGLIVVHSDDGDESLIAVPVTVEVIPSTQALLLIDPPLATVPISGTFTVDVVITDIVDLYDVAVEIHFNPALVEVVDDDPSALGVQITPGACPVPDVIIQNTADNALGTINYDAASLAPSPPCNGMGVVASITFHGLVEGSSPVHFDNWLLSDTAGLPIPTNAQDGQLDVIQALGLVAGVVDMQGRADNSGAEVCGWDGGVLADCTLTDASGNYSLPLLAGVYDITVEMERYLDSEKSGVVVTVGAATNLSGLTLNGGDANNDDIVNILDLAFMGARYLLICGDPGWDERADINNDCIVNIQDIVLGGSNYLSTSPLPWP